VAAVVPRERFPLDEGLVTDARAAFDGLPAVRFVVGGAGTGKSTVCAEIGRRTGIAVLDVDTVLYGDWFGRFDPRRHPAGHDWSSAPDPLAWQLSLDPDAFSAFHAASTAECLDLLAGDLAGREPGVPLLVDGGFGRPAVLARAVAADRIACLALPERLRRRVWTGSEERRAFLAEVAATRLPADADPVAAFLDLDERLHEDAVRDARATGVAIFERDETTALGDLVARVAAGLGIPDGRTG
jgi:hypothetical protein